jgi:hypothetical protein
VGVLLGGAQAVPTLTARDADSLREPGGRAAFAQDLQQAIERLVAEYHDDHARDGRRFTLLVVAHPEAR